MAGYTTNDQGICALKSESAYGTDAFGGSGPTDADTLPVASVQIKQVRNKVEGERLTATIAGECHGINKSHTDVSIKTMLVGSADAGDLPPLDALLKACGFSATVDAGVDVTYAPQLTQQAAMTVLHYQRNVNDGNARRIMARGVRGNMKLALEVGAEAMIEFTGQGLYDDLPPSDAAFPTLPTEYGADQCAWIVNTLALTVNAVTYPVESLTLETNWALDPIKTGDSVSGGSVGAVLLKKGKSGDRFGGNFVLVDGGAALTAAINLMQGGAKAALSAVLTKGARTITLTAAAVQLDTELDDQSPRYGINWYAVRANGESGDAHLGLVFA